MRIFALVFVLLIASSAAAQQNDLSQNSKSIAGSILIGDSDDVLRELTDRFGPRLAGTEAYELAAKWAAQRFRDSGLKDVKLEPFNIPNGWQRGSARGRMVAPVARDLHVASIGWSPSTPLGGLKGEVVLVDDLSPEAIKAESGRLRGRIVLLDVTKAIPEHDDNAFLHFFPASFTLFKSAGVLALLLPDEVPNNVLGDWEDADVQGTVLPLPALEIGLEDGRTIRRFLEQGPVALELECKNQVSGPVEVHNVIAELPGSGKPDEWILVGAHLDSWDMATGAQDNGTGVIMVLEAARAIAALGKAPRRSIRFALWGAEEPGPPGSASYVRDHANELNKCVAVLITDSGAGHPLGWQVQGRKDVRDSMEPISRRYLQSLGGGQLSEKVGIGSDHVPFMLEGIPALELWVEDTHYEEIHHKPSDTFDKVDPLNLKADAAIVAVTAYVLAQNEGAIAPHIDQVAVAEILKRANLEPALVYRDWKP
jgi:carboxypeptidase Q